MNEFKLRICHRFFFTNFLPMMAMAYKPMGHLRSSCVAVFV